MLFNELCHQLKIEDEYIIDKYDTDLDDKLIRPLFIHLMNVFFHQLQEEVGSNLTDTFKNEINNK